MDKSALIPSKFFYALPLSCFQVYSGARPLLEKTMKILVEGLVDIFLSLFYENKAKDLKMLDANGFCQLMLEVSYVVTFVYRRIIFEPLLCSSSTSQLKRSPFCDMLAA